MSGWSRLVRTVAPTAPVVTLAEAKRHLRVLHNDDDAEIEAAVAAATAMIEGPNGIGIAIMPQTWRLSLDHFPCEIIVPLGPVTAVDSIAYTDTNGDAATVATWRMDLDASPLRLWPSRDETWPLIYCEPGAVKVTFDCGFASIPEDLRWAILLLVGHLYENREAVSDASLAEIPMGAATILERYRVGRVA
ncbi:MAG: phage head-tail connector protein [Rhizobium sp.]|nr:phage head-tail connector protein [Rhizobium sp.]